MQYNEKKNLPELSCAEKQTTKLHLHSFLSLKQLKTMVKDFI